MLILPADHFSRHNGNAVRRHTNFFRGFHFQLWCTDTSTEAVITGSSASDLFVPNHCIGKQQTAKFYHKTGYEFVRFFGSIFVTSAGNFPVKMYVVCGHLCPKMCCKYDYQSSVAPELVPEIIFDQFVHLSGGTF